MLRYAAPGLGASPLRDGVETLINQTFRRSFRADYWRWKYLDPYVRDRSDMVVALDGDELVAAVHYQRWTWIVGDGREIDVMSGGDLVVSEDHRGEGLANALTVDSRDSVPMRISAALEFMFTRPRLGAHYEKVMACVRVPHIVDKHVKLLDWRRRLDALRASGLHDDLVERYPDLVHAAHTLEIRAQGAPPLFIVFSRGQIGVLPEAPGPVVDAVVTATWHALRSASSRRMRVRSMLAEIARRQMRVRVSRRKLLEVFRLRNAHLDIIHAMTETPAERVR